MKKLFFSFLMPVIMLQGLWVRKKIPRLQEPSGARTGSIGKGKPLRILIAGDSSAAGVGVSRQDLTLYGQLTNYLASKFTINWHVVAKTGWTTSELVKELNRIPANKYEVVLTATGVNDLTGKASVSYSFKNQVYLVETIRKRFSPDLILISGLPPIYKFPSLPEPLRWYVGNKAKQLDNSLQWWSEKQPDCEHISLDFPIDVENMAMDGFHPGPVIYKLWSDSAAEIILSKFF